MKALTALCLMWAGLVAGVSFLATPVKFRAPSLTLPVGLDVGRQTFGVFNKVEMAALVASCLLLLNLKGRAPRAVVASLGVVGAIMLLQSVWLLPLLDARMTKVLAHQNPPPAPFHWIYVALEVVKLGALLSAGAHGLRKVEALK